MGLPPTKSQRKVAKSSPAACIARYARAHDARVPQQPRDIPGTETRHLLGIKISESPAKCGAFAQDDAPGETRLESIQHQLLPQCSAVALRHTPFVIVIVLHQRITARPGAAANRSGRFRSHARSTTGAASAPQ